MRDAYWVGWNDAAWDRGWHAQDWPCGEVRRFYLAGWEQYHIDNPD